MLFGKIAKWFADLKSAAFYEVKNDLTQEIPGESVLDAAQGKELADDIATLNNRLSNNHADTVSTVGQVPVGGEDIKTICTCKHRGVVFLDLLVEYPSNYGNDIRRFFTIKKNGAEISRYDHLVSSQSGLGARCNLFAVSPCVPGDAFTVAVTNYASIAVQIKYRLRFAEIGV